MLQWATDQHDKLQEENHINKVYINCLMDIRMHQYQIYTSIGIGCFFFSIEMISVIV